MKVLRQVLDFYINTSIHVAVAVFSLVQLTKLSLNISTNINLDYFIFFGTIVGYNSLKYFEVFWKRIFNFRKKCQIIVVSLIAFLGMIYFYFLMETNIQIELFKVGIVVLIYPFLRTKVFLKMFAVSFCVTYTSIYIPLIHYNFRLEDIGFILFQRFLMIFCLLIPLEICDLKTDAKTIKTLPQVIGTLKTKFLGYLFLIVFCLLQITFYNFIFAFSIAICIFFSNENRSKYFTSFLVESLPIFWWGLLIFFRNFF